MRHPSKPSASVRASPAARSTRTSRRRTSCSSSSSGNVARERVAGGAQPGARSSSSAGALGDIPDDALAIVQQVLDVSADDRLGVLLMSEIRIHALRNPQLAAAYLAQEAEMRRSVTQIIEDIGRAKSLRFRLPADEAARLMLTVWEGAAVRAGDGRALDYEEMCRQTNAELARVAQLDHRRRPTR